MIGTLDRRAQFYNPTVVKDASGGHTNLWVVWHECWANWNQRSGSRSSAGSQDNLYTQTTIRVRYHQLIKERLNKDTMAIIRDVHYAVQDIPEMDYRQEYVTLELIRKATGQNLLHQNDLLVQSRIHKVTAEQAGTTTIVIPWLIGRTVISCISGRAIPFELITEGVPDATEALFDSTTGSLTVPVEAPFIETEEFEFIYR